MEEADALADRVGVLAKHMLDVGTTQHLRTKYGYGFHMHLVLKSAPRSSEAEMTTVKDWIGVQFPGAEMEREPWHGQLRFNIPSTTHLPTPDSSSTEAITTPSKSEEEPSVGSLFVLLEENKASLGLEFYSVQVSTFDEVFLKVVKKHGVGEEDHVELSRWKKFVLMLRDIAVRVPFM
jgi:ATP-binding cassette subfamily A (ABC1) protein 3